MTFKSVFTTIIAALLAVSVVSTAEAVSKKKIDRRVQDALAEFQEVVSNGDSLLRQAAGVLVFPRVTKAGLALGYERGNGAMMIDGETVEYYRLDSPSIGFQLGVQVRRQIFLFLEEGALAAFRNSENWEIGVDGSVALVTLDAGGEVISETFDKPVIVFVFGSKGLMYNLTLEGTKFSRTYPK